MQFTLYGVILLLTSNSTPCPHSRPVENKTLGTRIAKYLMLLLLYLKCRPVHSNTRFRCCYNAVPVMHSTYAYLAAGPTSIFNMFTVMLIFVSISCIRNLSHRATHLVILHEELLLKSLGSVRQQWSKMKLGRIVLSELSDTDFWICMLDVTDVCSS